VEEGSAHREMDLLLGRSVPTELQAFFNDANRLWRIPDPIFVENDAGERDVLCYVPLDLGPNQNGRSQTALDSFDFC
jgi:hypothetical protein